ncbi:signal recognition particle-docking protein FtsY [Agrobacterium vitis]|uniref:Signal recognition particle receptor FtsY n=1 Tax=Agrobacterium vitis TaxID=373 RepID=A0ABD6GFX2_AGRVI|nr:signal recognition particle-docking protein FtsY [Agrobacterium vitis]MUO79625.1 signal recognition particle-docking protein FtsY [Agrobacterium vitis]MUO97609.1 signal recognition particle-docking protein FtsY [Agrobacterium vitis]MUP06753.1 signal recognition particle-docking protein FtsY [Agrobacterium vitis]MUZ83554.1 signal recognition particle-docking protein FtsY [Agrobacterium vitis]MVA11955.1 signal recognition particle-docking protein FtsY [Agrobacterium vitis]
MALGFIKKVFTFGRDKPSEAGVDAGLSTEEKAAIAAESEPHDRVEQLPLAEDPVLAEEVDTAGGPSDDLVEDQADEDDVTADDLSLLPLSLLEAEEAAEEPPSDATPSFDELLDEAEGAAPGTEIALPRGFSTVVEPEPEPETPEVKQSWFQRLKAGLFRTSSQLTGQISALFTKRKLDEETLEELEDLLIQADLGVETAMRVTATLSSERYGKDVTGEDVTRIMAAEIVKVLKPVAKPLALDLNHKPHVILVVGVNGTGKTTTIGKLAAKLSGSGLKVMLAAGDTFRAAAIEQLKIWADRTGSTFIGTKLGADAAGLAYDAFEKAKAEKSDVLIIDTAGRLQNKTELMDELEKIVRVLTKLDPDAPHTVLQTLDATTGQNAMNQVEIFRNVAGVNGLIMTKLDGTARGGILVAIAAKHKLPVYFIGVGEGVDDLEPFEAEDFARAVAGFGPSS